MKRSFQHTIDSLFPISLFFVFSATALVVLLLSANIYRNIVSDSANAFEQETSLSYIAGKIRQNDTGGTDRIYLTKFDGCNALAIEQIYADAPFITYIYESEGNLKELFLKKGVEASAASGTTVMQIQQLEMYEISPSLFKFTCISEDGSSDSITIGVHSHTLE